MAPLFLHWLNLPNQLAWLVVGCVTGALSKAIYHNWSPNYLCCVDPSNKFLKKVKEKRTFTADFLTGNASSLPITKTDFDVVVSGLALNFFPDPIAAITEMKRVLNKQGNIAAYVWDYAEKMEFLRLFWDTAIEIDPKAVNLDEGKWFPICNTYNLFQLFEHAGLTNIETTFLTINTVFKNFDDSWNPFMGAQGPAPSYLASLVLNLQQTLKHKLQKKLQPNFDGSIHLLARAIAIKGNYIQ